MISLSLLRSTLTNNLRNSLIGESRNALAMGLDLGLGLRNWPNAQRVWLNA